MTLTGDQWNLGGKPAVPTVEQLRELCTDLLNMACDSISTASSGGFFAYCDGQEVNLGYENYRCATGLASLGRRRN